MSEHAVAVSAAGVAPAAPEVETFSSIPSVFPEGRLFRIVLNRLTFLCRFDPHPGAKRLVVNLKGLKRRKSPPASELNARKLARKTRSHVLSIWDPSMILNRRLRSGIFLGTETRDPIDGVLAITRELGRQLGLKQRRCVFMGRSGRGFAALMAASRMGTGAVVAAAQTDLWPIRWVKTASRVLAQFRRGISAEEMAEKHSSRSSVITAYREALKAGRTPRVALIYNQFDHHHYREHLQPFCRAFEAPIEGVSADGLILTYLVNHKRGHGVDRATIKRMIRAISHATGEGKPKQVKETADRRKAAGADLALAS